MIPLPSDFFFFFFFSFTIYTGARACIGRKYVACFYFEGLFILHFDRFFETEGIAVLVMFVSHYKITIKEEAQFAGETFEERKSRILSERLGLTLAYVLE